MPQLNTYNTSPGKTGLLRIVSGKFRGRKLRTIKGQSTRPTLDKTRETIFNILQSHCDLSSYEAFDLFAGSGALGFEALSRGAERVVFTEINRACISLLKSNIQTLSIEKQCAVYSTDAVKWIGRSRWAGGPKLFLLDPPYQSNLAQKVVDLLGRCDTIPGGSIIVLETLKEKSIAYADHFQPFRQKILGKTRVDFLEIETPADSKINLSEEV